MAAREVMPELEVVPRGEFLTQMWPVNYATGHHVTIIAPTQNGKTYLGFQLLQHVVPPRNPPVVLVMKPRDAEVTKWAKTLDYRRIQAWPPAPSIWRGPAPGYVLWPRHTYDPDIDDARMYREFRKAILGRYKQGNSIVVADEVLGLVDELKLGKEIRAVHTRGSGMGLGIWCMTQKPSHVGGWVYSQAEHLFLGNDPDKRNRERFAEIGGVDPEVVKHYVATLPRYCWLYIRRTGRRMCIVGP